MDSEPTSLVGPDDEWELCNDDGFIYKRKKRRVEEPSTAAPTTETTDLEAEERRRKERKRNTLLKLKIQYQKEIQQWEYLSNTLRAMQEKAEQRRGQDFMETAPLLASATKIANDTQIGCGSLVDELLLQVEAQEAIIQDISNLCDVADAMCNEQEKQLTQSFIDLPIWSSPREIMACLCDE